MGMCVRACVRACVRVCNDAVGDHVNVNNYIHFISFFVVCLSNGSAVGSWIVESWAH